ncbi:hypothetical protein [Clostridium sp.]|jgi:hypothetical protein|uniref:hypothetical protein n=1 Tax=Clostridium sp. TaxID=1506 RepID=UPI002FDE66F0
MEEFLSNSSKANLILIDLFYSEGYYETALDYIKKYEQTSVITEDLVLLKAKCLVMTGGFNECLAINNIDKKSSSYLNGCIGAKIINQWVYHKLFTTIIIKIICLE